jgi:hypothetical protein
MNQEPENQNGAVPDAGRQKPTPEQIAEAFRNFDWIGSSIGPQQAGELVDLLVDAHQFDLALEVMKLERLDSIAFSLDEIHNVIPEVERS